MITILIVDDEQLLRLGFRMIFEAELDLSVVGEAGDGTEAVRLTGQTPLAMAAEAARLALDDAGTPAAEVDGVIDFHTNDSASATDVGRAIGAVDLGLALDVTCGGNVAVTVVGQALAAVQAGVCDTVVVFRSFNGRSGSRYGSNAGIQFRSDMQFAAPHGYVVPAMWIAGFAQRQRHVYGLTDEDFGHIAVTTRQHAAANPHAMQRDPLDMQAYLSSRWIYSPRFMPPGFCRRVAASDSVRVDRAGGLR